MKVNILDGATYKFVQIGFVRKEQVFSDGLKQIIHVLPTFSWRLQVVTKAIVSHEYKRLVCRNLSFVFQVSKIPHKIPY